MYKIIKIFFLFTLLPLSMAAQVTPGENSLLNYRIVGFSFPAMKQMVNYKVEIAQGEYNNEQVFSRNISITVADKKNRIIAEVPSFGSSYTWRVIYTDRQSKTTTGELHHFSTAIIPEVNPDSFRLRIMTSAKAHESDYVFLDGNRTLYDMNGNPVWFFPNIENAKHEPMHARDLKVSPFGTVTAMGGEELYEVNYNGDVLWHGPTDTLKDADKLAQSKKNHRNALVDRDSVSLSYNHHHQFDRLPNGHYMAMTYELCDWLLPHPVDSGIFAAFRNKLKRDENGNYYQSIQFASLIEYDKAGKIVWEWKGSDYFKHSDLYQRMAAKQIFVLDNTHSNAFYFDDKNKTIYLSFRDLNRIVKIKYPTKKVLNTYGKLFAPGAGEHLYNGVFCGQHSCRLSKDGYLYMYNNNICNQPSHPTVIMFKEPKTPGGDLEKVWEYECPMDELSQQEQKKILFNAGGDVYELPDRDMFICMGSAYGKVLIVNRDKQVLWCAQPEKWSKFKKIWIDDPEYRASIMSRKDLESLIWGQPLKK